MLEAGINVSLGSDSLACSPTLSLLEQIKFLHHRDNIDPDKLLQMATINGAKSLQLSHLIGSIEKSKLCDFVVLSVPGSNGSAVRKNIVGNDSTVISAAVDGQVIFSQFETRSCRLKK
jgi:cytosine/adenosine deaminase-related metal-dependent hydrolase